MSRRQILALMIINVTSFASGVGIFVLLPVYLVRLGADPASTGTVLSAIFVAVALGSIIAGWVADRFQKRKLILILAAAVIAPLIWLIGSATTLTQLTILVSMAWFAAGAVGAMVGVLTGLFAAEHERGRIFGLIALGMGIGSTIGNFAAGPIADRWGYTALFQVSAIGYTVAPLAGLFLTDRSIPRSPAQRNAARFSSIFTNRTILLLFCASVLIHVANSHISLCKPLIMDSLRLDATAISTAGAIGTLVCMPLPFLVGWLSDHLGRKPFIVLCYSMQIIGLLVLTSGSLLWHFWIISILQNTLGSSIVAGQALVTDNTSKELLGRTLSLYGAAPSFGFVIGFSLAGSAMNMFGMTSSPFVGAVMALAAILLLLPISRPIPQPLSVG